MTYRVGTGFDAHRLVEGRSLVLGGVTVPGPAGLAGHSDADVLVHAVMDAILGAAAAGDIGAHFPDSDARFSGASSIGLLKEVSALVAGKGWRVVNIDSVVICETPKLAPYRDEMRRNIALAAGVEVGRVAVKATTAEGMGFTGRGEGIAAQAAVLLEEAPPDGTGARSGGTG